MFKKSKLSVLMALLIAMVMVVSACGNGGGDDEDAPADPPTVVDDDDNGDEGDDDVPEDPPEAAAFDTLTVVVTTDAISLDPHRTNDVPSAIAMAHIYNTLVYMDYTTLEIHPSLAVSWVPYDERTYEFTLRDDVLFHNGDLMTAHDVAFTIARSVAPGSETIAPIVGMFDPDTIYVVDDFTVRIGTYEPFAPFLAHLAHGAAAILNERAVTEGGEDYGTLVPPVGTGPFQLADWVMQVSMDLVRFDDHWAETSVYENLVFIPVVDGAQRTIQAETGAADIVMGPPAPDFARIEANDDIVLILEPALTTFFLPMNNNVEPLDDVRVRRAITHAIDMESLVMAITEGTGTVATSPTPPDVFGATQEDMRLWHFDPDRARELMEEAGHADGFSIQFLSTDAPTNIQIATMVQAFLADINIEVEIVTHEWAVFIEQLDDGVHDMAVTGWVAVTGDADYNLFPIYHSSQHGTPGNRSFFDNAELDALLDAARTSIDPAERLALYREAQEIIMYYAPQVFVNFANNGVILQDNVRGFVMRPNNIHMFTHITLD